MKIKSNFSSNQEIKSIIFLPFLPIKLTKTFTSLLCRYIGLSFFQISIMVGRKERQTFNIYNDAMKAFEEKYGNLYK